MNDRYPLSPEGESLRKTRDLLQGLLDETEALIARQDVLDDARVSADLDEWWAAHPELRSLR